ncbi:MAG: DUF5331 domain-containing protein [Microcystaceae cyanobacterium]
MSLSNEFEELKKGLKDKWLDYYKANRDWIVPLVNNHRDWTKLGDNKYCPPDYIILSAITALEPKFSQWLSVILDFQKDKYTIITELGLNFDPDVELKKRPDQYNKSVENILRLYYFFLANRSINNDIIGLLLGIYFVLKYEYEHYLQILEKQIEQLTEIQKTLEEIDNSQDVSVMDSQLTTYTDPDTEYLNQIREQIAREKEKENANL